MQRDCSPSVGRAQTRPGLSPSSPRPGPPRPPAARQVCAGGVEGRASAHRLHLTHQPLRPGGGAAHQVSGLCCPGVCPCPALHRSRPGNLLTQPGGCSGCSVRLRLCTPRRHQGLLPVPRPPTRCCWAASRSLPHGAPIAGRPTRDTPFASGHGHCRLPAKAKQTYHFLHDERHYSDLTIFAGLLAVPVVMGLSFICFLDAYYSRRPLDAGFQHAHAE